MPHQLSETPACLGSSIPPPEMCFAGSQNPVRSSNRDQGNLPIMRFLIINLRKARGKTLGHYWVLDLSQRCWHGGARALTSWDMP